MSFDTKENVKDESNMHLRTRLDSQTFGHHRDSKQSPSLSPQPTERGSDFFASPSSLDLSAAHSTPPQDSMLHLPEVRRDFMGNLITLEDELRDAEMLRDVFEDQAPLMGASSPSLSMGFAASQAPMPSLQIPELDPINIATELTMQRVREMSCGYDSSDTRSSIDSTCSAYSDLLLELPSPTYYQQPSLSDGSTSYASYDSNETDWGRTSDSQLMTPMSFMSLLEKPKQKKAPASRTCRVEGCVKGIRSRGLCKAHGGGRRCQTPGCRISDQGGGHCIAHGGGKRCCVDGCKKSAQSKGRCKFHGGTRRCRLPSCTKNGQIKGLCRHHYTVLLSSDRSLLQ